MEVDGTGEVVVTESQLVWREVKECLGREDFDKAVQLCNTGEGTSLSSRVGVRVLHSSGALCDVEDQQTDMERERKREKAREACRLLCITEVQVEPEPLSLSNGIAWSPAVAVDATCHRLRFLVPEALVRMAGPPKDRSETCYGRLRSSGARTTGFSCCSIKQDSGQTTLECCA